MIDAYITGKPYARAYKSMGQLLYLSTIAQVDAVVGNSSSGLYEVPSFNKPTVNIGDRQKGRLQALSVINCQTSADDIARAIREAFNKDCIGTVNPYVDGNSSKRILLRLKQIYDYKKLLKKHFYEVNF